MICKMCEKEFEVLYKKTLKCNRCIKLYNKFNYLKRRKIKAITQ